jgi:purine nucleoside permease
MHRTFVPAFVGMLLAVAGVARDRPIPVKVVVIAMFERGADTGDEPGELQYWVERNRLERVIPFPQGFRDLRMNREGVLAVLTGVGTAKSAAVIMALGMNPRFDLTKAYLLVAGISGINPERGSLGSAAWAEWVVDGDLAREIDARESPRAGRRAICRYAAPCFTSSRTTRTRARCTISIPDWWNERSV